MSAADGSIEKVVEAAVQAQVSKMITESLEGVDGLVGRIVAGAMQAKVKDAETYRDIPFIEKIARELAAWVEDNRDALRAEVERNLTVNKKTLATSMVTAFAEGASDRYALKVVIGDKE